MAGFGSRQLTFDTPTAPAVGPPAGLGDLFDAALETQRAQKNAYWIEDEREKAYDAHAALVKAETGIELANPVRQKRDDLGLDRRPVGSFLYYVTGAGEFLRRREDEYQARIEELARQHPDKGHLLRPDQRPDFAVVERAARAERGEQMAGDRRGGSWWLFTDPLALAAQFTGSMRGMIEDPANAVTLGLGPMGRVGVGGRALAWSAVKNGVANAGVEAAQQPFVQSWRQRAGLDAGLGNALGDIGMAFAFGGAIDLGVRGAYRGVRRVQGWTPELDADGGVARWNRGSRDVAAAADGAPAAAAPRGRSEPEDVLDDAARSAPASSRIRQAVDGDMDSLHMVAKEAGVDKDPAYRGARRAAEIDDAVIPPPPKGMDADAYQAGLQQAARATLDPNEPYPFLPAAAEAGALERLSERGQAAVMEAGRRQEQLIALLRSEDGQQAEARLKAGTADPVDVAATLREMPALDTADLPRTPAIEMGRDLTRLSDEAFTRVEMGQAPPEHGQLVARMVPNPRDHAAAMDLLAKAQPGSVAEARAVVADFLQRPRAEVHAALLGVDRSGTIEPDNFADPDTGVSMSRSDVEAVVDMWRYVQLQRAERQPETLAKWLMRSGRVQDQSGEISNILGGRARYLISGNGRSLDDAALAAWEQGFLPTMERPTVRQFLEALDEDVRNNSIVRDADAARAEDLRIAREMETELDKVGLGQVRSEKDIYDHFRSSQGGSGPQSRAAVAGGAGGQVKGINDPAGADAKAQTETLRRDLTANLARPDMIDKLMLSLREGRPTDRATDVAENSAPRLTSTAYTPAFARAQDALREDIIAQAVKTLPPSVRIAVEDRIRIGAYELNGYFNRRDNLLAVALDSEAQPTFRHERIHALKEHGLFTDAEWGLLVERANKDRMRAEIGREDLAQYSHLYGRQIAIDRMARRIDPELANRGWSELEPHLIKAGLYDPADPRGSLTRAGLWDEARLQGMLDEEAVAKLAERWRTGERFGAKIDRVLERVMEFLERLRNVLKGHGFQTVDDVFRKIDSGEVGMRTPREHTLPGGGKVRGVLITDLMAAIKAFHGSPHDFDRFDMSKIGTGEGAQAYGRGMYFAEAEGVAKEYRDTLSNFFDYRGKLIPTNAEMAQRLGYDMGSLPAAHDFLISNKGNLDRSIRDAQKLLAAKRAKPNDRFLADVDAGELEKAILEMSETRAALGTPWLDKSKGGRMYEVKINADPETFLDFDLPLSQQPQAVRPALEKVIPKLSEKRDLARDQMNALMGQPPPAQRRLEAPEDLFSSLAGGRFKSGEVEDALREAGISGVKYLDQGSRSAGQGSRNYVVFDDKLIEIVAKDGQPVDPLKADMAAATRAGELGQMAEACKL